MCYRNNYADTHTPVGLSGISVQCVPICNTSAIRLLYKIVHFLFYNTSNHENVRLDDKEF